jgi:hypothetical protein
MIIAALDIINWILLHCFLNFFKLDGTPDNSVDRWIFSPRHEYKQYCNSVNAGCVQKESTTRTTVELVPC